jgi:hypothetical protein
MLPLQDSMKRPSYHRGTAVPTTSPHQRQGPQIPNNPDNMYNSYIMDRDAGDDTGGWGEYLQRERANAAGRIDPGYSERLYRGGDGLGQGYGQDSSSPADCRQAESAPYSYRGQFPYNRSYLSEVKVPSCSGTKGDEDERYWEKKKAPKGSSESSNYVSPCKPSSYCDYSTASNVAAYPIQGVVPVKKTPPTSSSSNIEVAPGIFTRLRGAEETKMAIVDDFFMPCECPCCSQTIFCIQDADFVLCPDCRVIHPMEGGAGDSGAGGVGLGFKMETLMSYQQQIMCHR